MALQTPLTFIISVCKATACRKPDFLTRFATTRYSLICTLLKKIPRGPNGKPTQEVKDYGRYNAGEKQRNSGMERHMLLRASANEGKYVEEWLKKPQ